MTPATFRRGKVVSLLLTVEYPDKSRKSMTVVAPDSLAAVVFDDCLIAPHDRNEFNVSVIDWTANPTAFFYLTPPAPGLPPTPGGTACASREGMCAPPRRR